MENLSLFNINIPIVFMFLEKGDTSIKLPISFIFVPIFSDINISKDFYNGVNESLGESAYPMISELGSEPIPISLSQMFNGWGFAMGSLGTIISIVGTPLAFGKQYLFVSIMLLICSISFFMSGILTMIFKDEEYLLVSTTAGLFLGFLFSFMVISSYSNMYISDISSAVDFTIIAEYGILYSILSCTLSNIGWILPSWSNLIIESVQLTLALLSLITGITIIAWIIENPIRKIFYTLFSAISIILGFLSLYLLLIKAKQLTN